MKLIDYITRLQDLEVKRQEVQNVLDNYAFGYARTVLEEVLVDLDKEINDLRNLNVVPALIVVSIILEETQYVLTVGDTLQLSVQGLMSDGTIKDITKSKDIITSFTEYDYIKNAGKIVRTFVSSYTGGDETFALIKTADGWDVKDTKNTLGLYVAPTTDPQDPTQQNVFGIFDLNGNPVGVYFQTDGNDAVGDNYKLHVRIESSGTHYSSSDPTVATVSEDGLITAVAPGQAEIHITNGDAYEKVTINVS